MQTSVGYIRRRAAFACICGFAVIPTVTIAAPVITNSSVAYESFRTYVKERKWEQTDRLMVRVVVYPMVTTVVYAYSVTPRVVEKIEREYAHMTVNASALRISASMTTRCMGVWLGSLMLLTFYDSHIVQDHAFRWPVEQKFRKVTNLPNLPPYINDEATRVMNRMAILFPAKDEKENQIIQNTQLYYGTLAKVRAEESEKEKRYRSWPMFDTLDEGLTVHGQTLGIFGLAYLILWGASNIVGGSFLIPIGYFFAKNALKKLRQVR